MVVVDTRLLVPATIRTTGCLEVADRIVVNLTGGELVVTLGLGVLVEGVIFEVTVVKEEEEEEEEGEEASTGGEAVE